MIGMLVTPYAEDAFGQLGIQWIVGTPRKKSPSPRLQELTYIDF